ncbi:MAG: hypothetical protein ACREDP_13360, partial [Bradyrhizobium sp.]
AISAATADPVIARAATTPNANFFMMIPLVAKIPAIRFSGIGRLMLWRDGHSDAERVRLALLWPWSLQPHKTNQEAAWRRSTIWDFGDNKSRLASLQTAEFTAIFDPQP